MTKRFLRNKKTGVVIWWNEVAAKNPDMEEIVVEDENIREESVEELIEEANKELATAEEKPRKSTKKSKK